MVSYADLGGLGAREGIPVACTWEPPQPEQPEMYVAATTSLRVLPWLLILLPLFLFRPNRDSAAWWIWLPVVVSAVVGVTVNGLLTGNEQSLSQGVGSFIVGLAAMWLLMPFLESRSRMAIFFKALPVLAGFSLLAFVPTLLADRSGSLELFMAGMLPCASLAATLALVLSGLAVRRRFGRIRFLLWLTVWAVLAWTAIAAPFAIFGSLGGRPEWGEFVVAVLVVSGFMLALFLPLVLISFFQPFYRARFFKLFNMPQPDLYAGAGEPPGIPEVYQAAGTTSTMGTER